MNVPPARVVFIGLCSADPVLLRQWSASGELPAIGRLLADGLTGQTAGLPGVYVGTNWPGFISGLHPGNNRVHSWQQLKPGSYETYRCAAGDHAQGTPFWERLSDAGRRVCVLDIPHSRISPGLNGIQTVEWGAHDAAYGFAASSAALHAEIVARFGLHPVSGNSDADRTPAELLDFASTLVEGVRKKRDLTLHYLAAERWDFFAQVFTEGHCAGHLMWHLHDPDHPRHAQKPAGSGDPLLAVYRAIDQAVGEIVAALDDDVTLVLLANQGFGPKYSPDFLFEKILLNLGVASPRPPARPRPSLRRFADPVLSAAWRTVPAPLQRVLEPLRGRTRDWVLADRQRTPLIDAAASDCFPVQNNTATSAVRINLKGREPAGRIEPGEEYESLLQRLHTELKALRYAGTDVPAVSEIYRCDELYPGPERDHLPDLFVNWSQALPVSALESPGIGHLEGRDDYCRTGDHRPPGLFVVTGPGHGTGELPGIYNCLDFAPTFGALLGVSLPGDGQPIPGVTPIPTATVI